MTVGEKGMSEVCTGIGKERKQDRRERDGMKREG